MGTALRILLWNNFRWNRWSRLGTALHCLTQRSGRADELIAVGNIDASQCLSRLGPRFLSLGNREDGIGACLDRLRLSLLS